MHYRQVLSKFPAAWLALEVPEFCYEAFLFWFCSLVFFQTSIPSGMGVGSLNAQ